MTKQFNDLQTNTGTLSRGLLDSLQFVDPQTIPENPGSVAAPVAAPVAARPHPQPVPHHAMAANRSVAARPVPAQSAPLRNAPAVRRPAPVKPEPVKTAPGKIRLLSMFDNLTTRISDKVLEKLPAAVGGKQQEVSARQMQADRPQIATLPNSQPAHPAQVMPVRGSVRAAVASHGDGSANGHGAPIQVEEVPAMATPLTDTQQMVAERQAQAAEQKFVPVAMVPEKSAAWPAIIANISLEAPAGVLQFETIDNPARPISGKLVEIRGHAGDEPFHLVVEPTLVEVLVLAHDPEVSHFTDDPVDLSILIEFLAHKLIERIEQSLKCDITLDEARLVDQLPNHPWYWLQCEVNDQTLNAAIAISAGLRPEMERFVENMASPEERALSRTLRVKIGPVSLPGSEALHTGPGDVLDCGVNPRDDVRGILERSDGRFWPVLIEDNSIVVSGELCDPIMPGDASEIIAGFELGTITLAHHARRNIVPEARIPMTRLPDGTANIWLANRLHGSGKLDVINDSLCVELGQLGESK